MQMESPDPRAPDWHVTDGHVSIFYKMAPSQRFGAPRMHKDDHEAWWLALSSAAARARALLEAAQDEDGSVRH